MRLGPTLLLTASLAQAAPAPEEFVEGSVIVKYRGQPERALRTGDPRAAVAALAADPSVEWAEREHVRRRSGFVTANDPLFDMQWNLTMVRLPEAWSRSLGSDNVVVAVIDSGIKAHPDLRPRYLPGWDFVSNVDNAGDGDGRDDDPTDPGTPDESSSALHGMHVAGILGAHTDNAVGMAGVDWNCRILPVRVLGVQGGKGSDTDIADAIRWAAGIHVAGAPDNPTPAQVINLSFGGPGGSGLLQAAVNDAVALGVIVVAAAGNDGADASAYAPAGLDHVIAVGAVDQDGKLAYYSNRGPRVDLVAPGGDLSAGAGVVSTLWSPTDGWMYVAYNGTSQAAPHVAGVAALLKAIDPTIGADRARTLLSSTADPSHACAEGCGGGLLDADAALAAAQLGCADGHCIAAGANGNDVVGGCAIAGHRSGAAWLALVVVLLGALLRRRISAT